LVFLNKKALELKNSLKRLHIKKLSTTSFVALFITILLLTSTAIYYLLRQNIIENDLKEKKILFYKIQSQSNALLSQMLYNYHIMKEKILYKHHIVKNYLKHNKDRPLDVNLTNILAMINSDNNKTLYNIEISDKNYILKNSTYKPDINFDLSFAKETFEEHYDANTTGVCIPLFEKNLKRFMSYADAYLIDKKGRKNGILLVSYQYYELKEKLLEIQKLIAQYKNIESAKAYVLVNNKFHNYIELQKNPPHKPSLEEMLSYINNTQKIVKKLSNNQLKIQNYKTNDNYYTGMYLLVESSLDKNIDIVYEIILNNATLQNKLKDLNFIFLFLLFIGLLAILLSISKEKKFNAQDKFMQSSMHELKTPLSIITLNNELRELEYGVDDYSQEISNAIKTLKNSYDDISFTLTNDGINYPQEIFSLPKVLQERVSYFKSIVAAKNKTLQLQIEGNCQIKISLIELIRLIDNNLSNAIKYSKPKSTITVTLNNGDLSFHTFGEPIHNKEKIFEKYRRENSVVGGHGLGLSIVKEIAKKYAIKIELTSSQENGTTFSYRFQCHTDDI